MLAEVNISWTARLNHGSRPAGLRRVTHGPPAGGDELVVGVLEPVRRGYRCVAIVDGASTSPAWLVGAMTSAMNRRLLEEVEDGLEVGVLVARKLGDVAVAHNMLKDEGEVGDRGPVGAHGRQRTVTSNDCTRTLYLASN